MNRVTRDVQLHLTPQTDGTALTVDYLTDLNGDGVYELLDGGEEPVYDRLTANGSLASASSGIAPVLAAGSTYTLTADTLLDRGSAAVTDRASGGSVSYLPGLTVLQPGAGVHSLYGHGLRRLRRGAVLLPAPL